jgi:hypothetical protein
MLLLERSAPTPAPAPAQPATLEAAREQADRAQQQAAQLAADAGSAVDELASYLAVENVDDAAAIMTAIGNARDDVATQSVAAKAASDSCQLATTVEAALVPWEAALSARDAAKRAADALKVSTAQARRVPVVAGLDKAAKILVTAFTTITAALTAAGFAAGDFTFFYRNHLSWALVYLILAAVAIFVGTFAFLVDSVEAQWKLRAEQAAIYLGVASFGIAFIIAVGTRHRREQWPRPSRPVDRGDRLCWHYNGDRPSKPSRCAAVEHSCDRGVGPRRWQSICVVALRRRRCVLRRHGE